MMLFCFEKQLKIMKINIESVRKKEFANSIDFDYSIDESALDGYLPLLEAEKIGFIKISGNISQKSGLAAIDYAIETKFWAECARCNKESAHTIKISGEKYIADKSDEKDTNEEFYIPESDGIIDLDDFITEFLGVEIPARYLCDEDCKGLCLKCGEDLNNGDCPCPKKEKNPAFAVLDDFFKE